MRAFYKLICLLSCIVLSVIMLCACDNKVDDSSVLVKSEIGSVTDNKESEIVQTDEITKASAVIEVLTGNKKSERHIFKDGETVLLGRDPSSCQLVLDESYKYVSRKHCSVLFDKKQDGFYVTDFSTNGTFFENESKLEKGKPTFIPNNTKLILADKQCIIELKVL